MEAVLGLVALGVSVLLFVGANLVAIALMVGGRGNEATSREADR